MDIALRVRDLTEETPHQNQVIMGLADNGWLLGKGLWGHDGFTIPGEDGIGEAMRYWIDLLDVVAALRHVLPEIEEEDLPEEEALRQYRESCAAYGAYLTNVYDKDGEV